MTRARQVGADYPACSAFDAVVDGYALIWGVMLAVGAGMLVYFRRKRWF